MSSTMFDPHGGGSQPGWLQTHGHHAPNPNTACLRGMQCPVVGCQSYGPFYIDVFVAAKMTDNGADWDCPGEIDWDEGSRCCCPECDYDATVDDFIRRIPPLEQLARAREAERKVNDE